MTSSTAVDRTLDSDAKRVTELSFWLRTALHVSQVTLTPVTGDASFRRYFRITRGAQSFIVMDAPPENENVRAFVQVGQIFSKAGIRVPKVYACDPQRGFLLLEDFGDQSYFAALKISNADFLYCQAMSSLERIQCQVDINISPLPTYDQNLLTRELELFRKWLVESWLELEIPYSLWHPMCQLLIENALEQPQVCVHRDFHSRNLMVLPEYSPGVLDFQDAVIGPITYDIVSLFKDCYIEWPRHKLEQWRENYRERLMQKGYDIEAKQWAIWFNRMGMQRHLKACGIFSRLWLRDQKPQYLKDIPRVLRMLFNSAQRDPEFEAFAQWLSRIVIPAVERQLLST